MNESSLLRADGSVRAVSGAVVAANPAPPVPQILLAHPKVAADFMELSAAAAAWQARARLLDDARRDALLRRRMAEANLLTLVRSLPFVGHKDRYGDDWRSVADDLAEGRLADRAHLAPGDYERLQRKCVALRADLGAAEEALKAAIAAVEGLGNPSVGQVARDVAEWCDRQPPRARLELVCVAETPSLEAARAAVDRARAEIAWIEAAPVPMAEARATMCQHLDSLERKSAIHIAQDGSFSGRYTDPELLLAFVLRPLLQDWFSNKLRAYDRTGAIPAAERPARLAAAREALIEAEYVEEAAVRALGPQGAVLRRSGNSPETYLMVRVLPPPEAPDSFSLGGASVAAEPGRAA